VLDCLGGAVVVGGEVVLGAEVVRAGVVVGAGVILVKFTDIVLVSPDDISIVSV